MLPETNYFQVLKAERETKEAQRAEASAKKTNAFKAFMKEGGHGENRLQCKPDRGHELITSFRISVERKLVSLHLHVSICHTAVKTNGRLIISRVVTMVGFNSISHGTQDFYPTFLKNQLRFSPTQTTIVTVVGQVHVTQ